MTTRPFSRKACGGSLGGDPKSHGDRIRAAHAKARANGKRIGRPPTHVEPPPEALAAVAHLSNREAATHFGVSTGTIARWRGWKEQPRAYGPRLPPLPPAPPPPEPVTREILIGGVAYRVTWNGQRTDPPLTGPYRRRPPTEHKMTLD